MRSSRLLPAFALALLALPAAALESVELRLTGIADDSRREALEARLRNASAVVAAESEGVEAAQDLFGTALSDYANMVGVMYAEGYYGPEVSIRIDGREAADINPFSPPQRVDRVEIVVDSGPRFVFGLTRVAPRAAAATAEPIVSDFAPGRPARADLIGSAARAGVREWRREGHAKAAVGDQDITADHRARELDVDIRLAPGPRLRFGALAIGGDSDVSDRRVRAIMGYPEGEVFSPEELRESVNRLRRTGTFRTVTMVAADTPNPDDTLDYQLTLVEQAPRRFGVSAEFSTLDGVTVGGFWLHRNLRGGAERLRIEGQASNIGGDTVGFQDQGGIDYALSARLTRPGTFGPDNDVFVFGDLAREDEPDYLETSGTFGVGITRYFTDALFGRVSGGLRYSRTDDAFGERSFFHAVLPSRLEWDRRDDPGDPKSGFYLNLEATPFVGLNALSQTGAQGQFDARSYLAFGAAQGTVLAGRVQLGSVVGSDLDATPQEYLFYSGGGDTVRGFSYQSLGVTLPDGRETGGRSFLGLSAELRQDITDAIGVVGFVDVGYIGQDSFIDADAGQHTGVGLGGRFSTPIGPIRADLATPYSDDDRRFTRWELYIGVGQAF